MVRFPRTTPAMDRPIASNTTVSIMPPHQRWWVSAQQQPGRASAKVALTMRKAPGAAKWKLLSNGWGFSTRNFDPSATINSTNPCGNLPSCLSDRRPTQCVSPLPLQALRASKGAAANDHGSGQPPGNRPTLHRCFFKRSQQGDFYLHHIDPKTIQELARILSKRLLTTIHLHQQRGMHGADLPQH